MLTLRALPLSGANGNRIVDIYSDALRRHWRLRDRLAGNVIGLSGITGWSAEERRMLAPEIRRRGVSMADRRGIHRLLNPAAIPIGECPLRDKNEFAHIMQASGIPIPLHFQPGKAHLSEWIEAQHCVLAKPSFSSKGRGVRKFERHGSDWLDKTRIVGPGALLDTLQTVLVSGGAIQSCVATKAGYAALSPGALPTLRVMTFREADGTIKPHALVIRLSRDRRNAVDNFNAGNLACPISPAGVIGKALAMRAGKLERFSHHPETGALVDGMEIGEIGLASSLASAAHRAMGDGFSVIGWDIGLGENGPVVIEGNWNPGTDILQLTAGAGLDDLPIGEHYRQLLGAVTGHVWQKTRPFQFDSQK